MGSYQELPVMSASYMTNGIREIYGYQVPSKVFEYMANGSEEKGVNRLINYRTRMLIEYEKLKSWLPLECMATLDIGCGLGGIDIELARQAGTGIIHLIDGDGTGQRKNGLQKSDKPWGRVDLAHDFVLANTSPTVRVRGYMPWNIPALVVDCIISLKSWGHHYPIDTYTDLAQRVLLPGGRIITDIRFGTGGAKFLRRRGFELIGKCNQTPKCERLVFEKR